MNQKKTRGVILAGGTGSRLYPATKEISKQMLPIYDKPMIYYPLSVLMLAGIRKILIITDPRDYGRFQNLLRDGSRLGLEISYVMQAKPEGIAQALTLADWFIEGRNCCLILGDNLFYGHNLPQAMAEASSTEKGAVIFACWVKDPQRYGVVDFDEDGRAVSVEEKPVQPKSNYAIPGLYFFDKKAAGIAAGLKPSARGELEITDVIRDYLRRGELTVKPFVRGFVWLDTGTFESLADATAFVRIMQERQELKIACIEEIAWRMKFIDTPQLEKLAGAYGGNEYGQYLRRIIREKYWSACKYRR